jgi:hypothetical protein
MHWRERTRICYATIDDLGCCESKRSMSIGLEDSARHLGRQAPYWQVSVVAAVVFTVAWIAHLGYLALGNPESDTRLAAYVSASEQADRLAAPGETCEHIALALANLTQADMWRSGARQSWSAAVSDGEHCRDELASSDTRFAALVQAVSAAETNPSSVQAAAETFESLDAFDRSRKRYQDETPVVEKAEGYVTAVAASDQRLAVLGQQTAAFDRSQAPADALGVVHALNDITDLDRARSSGSQQQTLTAAEAAAQAVRASRAKLSRLSEAVTTAENAPMPDSERDLVAAVAAVTPFDEGVATAEQRQALVRGRAAAVNVAWTMLRQDVAALGQNAAPSDYEAVIVPYEFLRDTPPGSLSEDQRIVLSKARAADDAVASSNARLASLLKADSVWRQQGISGGGVVLNALASITPFDRSRFNDPDTQAWEVLSRAEVILNGPKIGFTASNKDRLLIFIAASDGSANTGQVVDALSGALRGAGFQVASDQKDAALIAAVTVESVGDPTTDLSGGFMEWVSTSRIGVRAFWAADEKVLFSDEVVETARTREKGTAQARALLAGVDAILDRFTKAAAR